MYYYTYKITLTKGHLNGKVYFGKHKTDNLDDNYKGSGKIIKDYYRKYPDGYIKEILNFYNSSKELNKAEIELISKHLGKDYCLNIAKGGDGGNTWNNLPDEQKDIIRNKCITRCGCKKIEYNGKVYNSIMDMCKDNNINYLTYLTNRSRGFPKNFHPLHKRTICDNKEYSSIEKMCKDNNINNKSFSSYLSRYCKDRENINYHGHKIKILNEEIR